VCIVVYSMYMTMSISNGEYPNLDLWNANKLQLQACTGEFKYAKRISVGVL